MKIYISGPMSGIENLNEPAFREAAAKLKAAGHEPVLPHDNGLPKQASYWAHMRADVIIMMHCDGVAMLDGWKKSKGARIERSIACELGFPVHPLKVYLVNMA